MGEGVILKFFGAHSNIHDGSRSRYRDLNMGIGGGSQSRHGSTTTGFLKKNPKRRPKSPFYNPKSAFFEKNVELG